jgi:hypothetical protein
MKKSVMYKTIVTALAVGLGCVPVATDAFAAGPHDGGGIVLIHGGGGHFGGGGGHFGGSGFGGDRFGDGAHFGRRSPYDPYWWAYDSLYDYDQCWHSERVHTATGWHWQEVWVCG